MEGEITNVIAYTDTGTYSNQGNLYDTTSPTWARDGNDGPYTNTYFGQRSEPEEKPAPLPFMARMRVDLAPAPSPLRMVARPRRIHVPVLPGYQRYRNKRCWTGRNFHKE